MNMVFIMAKDYIYKHTHTEAQLKQGWRASLILFTILTLSPDTVLSVHTCIVIFTYVQVHVEARD